MIIATIAFVTFLVAVVAGVIWMIKQDANYPDTEFTLLVDRITRQMPERMGPAFEKIRVSIKQAHNAMANLNEAFRASQKKHGIR